MGHKGPNMLGADAASLKRAIRPLIPEYMPMGTTGMDGMTEMQTDASSDHSKPITAEHMRGRSRQMAMPENSIAMMGGKGPHGIIDIGGMFTVLKVRERASHQLCGSRVSGAAKNGGSARKQARPRTGGD